MRNLALILLLPVLAACNDQNASAPGGGKGAPPPPKVGFVVVQRQTVDVTTELAGRVVPNLVAEVRPQVAGIIEKRFFTEGSEVKEGELLYQIADASYRASVASANAALDRARAALIAAQARANRYTALANREVASQQDQETAIANAEQAKADVAAATAALAVAEINLGYTKLQAPISGRIGVSTLTQGALVTANQQAALATIQALDTVFVDVPQSATAVQETRAEIQSGRLTSAPDGVRMRLILDNGQVYPYEGIVKLTDVTVNQGTGTVTLRAIFANPERVLLPNMFVRGIATLGSRGDVTVAPQRAITRDPRGQATAFVIGQGDKVELRRLEVSRSVGNAWIVEQGLARGDRLVMDGFQRIRPGLVVSPVPFDAADPTQAAPAPSKQSKQGN